MCIPNLASYYILILLCHQSFSLLNGRKKAESLISSDYIYSLFNFCQILRMAPRTSLFQLEAESQHYCEDHWDALKNQHNEVDYLDLLKYCFSSAYMLALLHDVLGIAMEEKRYYYFTRKVT